MDAGKQMDDAADGTPEYERTKKRFIAVADRLAKEATDHAVTAEGVRDLVTEFRNQTSDDHSTVRRLKKEYEDRFGEGSARAEQLKKDIEDTRNLINTLNDEYNHAVVVSATTPTYAWVYPFGTIAAITVAGIYGDKAVKLRNAIDRTRERLGQLQAEERERITMLAGLSLARKSLQGIQTKMEPAIEALDKASKSWRAVATDIGKLRNLVAGMEGEFALYLDDVEQAISEWKLIAEKADAYRAHAHIQIEPAAAAA